MKREIISKRMIAFLITFFMMATMVPFVTRTGVSHGASNWETEDNGGYKTADPITVNTTWYGKIGEHYEEDYYWFRTSKAGVVTLNFHHPYVNSPNEYWTVYLMDDEFHTISFEEVTGTQTNVIFSKMGLPAGTYYVIVEDASFYYPHSSVTYDFRVNFSTSSVWETESNNGKTVADAVRIGTRFYGNIAYYKMYTDEDYYWFPIRTKTKLNLNFSHGYINNAQDFWNISVFDQKYHYIADFSVKGNKTSTTKNLGYLSAGNYYIKVDSANNKSTKDYSFLLLKNNKPNSTSFRSLKAGKRKIVLSWKKSSDATGYQIYRATKKNGKYKKIKTIKKRNTIKYTNKRLKKGKRYYYKVRAYKKVSGKTYYSSFSKAKSKKVK